MLSYGVTEMLDGALLKIATSLVIQDVRIFNSEEFSSFFIRTKLLYYNIESIFVEMLPSEQGTLDHYFAESMEAYSQQIRGLLAALSDNDEAEKPVEKKRIRRRASNTGCRVMLMQR